MEIGKFEVGIIRNGLRATVAVGNDYNSMINIYNKLVEKDKSRTDNVQYIIFMFDYDKNTNIEYYDSYVDK